jgi:hypothetical protein
MLIVSGAAAVVVVIIRFFSCVDVSISACEPLRFLLSRIIAVVLPFACPS